MSPRAPGGQRDVRPVVHENGDRQRFPQASREGHLFPRRSSLPPELNGCHPSLHRVPTELDRIPSAEERVIGDEQELQVVR